MKNIVRLAVFTILISCNQQLEVTNETLGYDYYPIVLGQYRIYDVEEIDYKLSGFDTMHYQLRETIFDSLVSPDQTSYLIRRDKRGDVTEKWKSDSVWTATLTSNYLAISENSVPFMKLTFPVELGREWNGNSLNTKPEITYYYQPATEAIIDSVVLDDHIRLIIEDIEPNIVSQDERSEVYARGIGLVQKHYLTLQFCTADCNEIGEIEAGRFLSQILIEAGNE
ncbi:MAG: hypothetical protein ABJG78_11730 [Cyclobacteriaceae bacterium]